MITVGPTIRFDPTKGEITAAGKMTPNQARVLARVLAAWAEERGKATRSAGATKAALARARERQSIKI